MQASARVSPLAKWTLIVLSSLMVSFFIVAGIASAKYAHTALPNTVLLGKNIGGYNAEKATKYYSDNPPYVSGTIKFQINNDVINIKPEVIGISVNTESSIQKALNYGKTKGIVNFKGMLSLFGRKTVVYPEYNIDDATFQSGLKNQLGQYEIAPTNAEITIVDNVATITPDQSGKGINYAKAKATLSEYISKEEIPVIPIEIVTESATITAYSLETMKQYVTNSISGPVEFYNTNGKLVATADVATIFSWLDTSALQTSSIVVNQDLVTEWLGSNVVSKIEVAAKTKIVSEADQSVVIQAGSVGKAVNETALANTCIDLIKSNPTNRKITVSTTDVQPTVKTQATSTGTSGLYPGRYIEVDLSSQTLYRYEGTNLVGTHRVSTGKWSTPTPTGSYSINSKTLRAYSSTYDLYMPYWMAFIGSSYGIHELPEWANGTKEGQSHLGTPVSHGCIRLGVGDAATVYYWAEIGTPVVVHS